MVDLGKERFAWLLKQRDIPFWDATTLEQRIEVKGKKPDFYAEPSRLPPFLAEVKGFHKPGPFRIDEPRASTVRMVPPDKYLENLKRIGNSVKKAADQLKPYAPLGIPMMVVLDNAGRVGIFLGTIELIQLLGMFEYRAPVNMESVGPAYLHYGPEQVLTPEHKLYLSAIAVNLPKQGYQYDEPVEQERPMRLRIFHNPYARVPLPLGIFSDPEDEHIGWPRADG